MFESFLVLGLYQDQDVVEPRYMNAFAQVGVDVGQALLAAHAIDTNLGVSLVVNDRTHTQSTECRNHSLTPP